MDDMIRLGGAGVDGISYERFPAFDVGDTAGGGDLTPEQRDATEREDLFAQVCQVLNELIGVDLGSITKESRFKEDLDIDSLGLVEIVMALEDRLDLKVAEERLEGVNTVGLATDLLLQIKYETANDENPDDEDGSGVREPRVPVPKAPAGSKTVD